MHLQIRWQRLALHLIKCVFDVLYHISAPNIRCPDGAWCLSLSLDHAKWRSKIFLTLFLNFPTFSFCVAALCQTVEAMGGLRLNSRPEQQLQSKPAKLTGSPWASHMHYSNQSILDHPDTLDIWVSVFSCRHHLFLLPCFLNFFPRCSPSE